MGDPLGRPLVFQAVEQLGPDAPAAVFGRCGLAENPGLFAFKATVQIGVPTAHTENKTGQIPAIPGAQRIFGAVILVGKEHGSQFVMVYGVQFRTTVPQIDDLGNILPAQGRVLKHTKTSCSV